MFTAPSLLSSVQPVWQANALLGEGPVWSVREQCLYWVDILGHRLHRCDVHGEQQRTWTFDQEISSVAEHRTAPELIVTLRHEFASLELATGTLKRLALAEPDRPNNRFNDGKCDAAGRYWAGTMDFAGSQTTGAVYCLDAQGQCTRHLDEIAITNGPGWSADGRTMYVASTATREIFAFDFDPGQGTLRNRRLWLRFSEADGYPDGMTCDAAGRLWIAHWGAGCVTCRAPDATELLRVRVPASCTTSCAFGGENLTTLFITSACCELTPEQKEREPYAGSVFKVEIDSPGVPASQCAVAMRT